jgi:CTP synthase
MRIAGVGDTGDVRAFELPQHHFYVTTLFHPQLESRPGKPSPFVMAFVNAARGRSATASAVETH